MSGSFQQINPFNANHASPSPHSQEVGSILINLFLTFTGIFLLILLLIIVLLTLARREQIHITTDQEDLVKEEGDMIREEEDMVMEAIEINTDEEKQSASSKQIVNYFLKLVKSLINVLSLPFEMLAASLHLRNYIEVI